MKFRTLTIWATGLMLIVTFVVPTTCLLVVEGFPANSPTIVTSLFCVLFGMLMLWLFSGSPMLVSFIIARRMEYDVPALILFVSTVGYGFLFVYAQYLFLADYGGCMRALSLLTPLASLYWMIPTWVVALILNARYVKKVTSHPGIARSTAPSPALGEDENEIK